MNRLPLLLAALLAAPPILAASACAQTAPTPSLAEALAVIRSHRKVDLTHPLDAATPMPPGFAQPRIAPAVDPRTLEPLTIARDGRRATFYGFAGPAGTHVIAPASAVADGTTLDAIPADEMLLPLVVLDATAAAAAARDIDLADLASYEAAHGRVPAGAFVALRTGIARQWGLPAFQRPHPGWSAAVLTQLFEERGVVAVGQESQEAGLDRAATAYLLEHGHWMLSGLDKLDAVPATGAAILVSWPRIANGFSFPARAMAVLP